MKTETATILQLLYRVHQKFRPTLKHDNFSNFWSTNILKILHEAEFI